MEWNPADVVSVTCVDSTTPKYVRISLANLQAYDIPYTFYQIIQQPLGLPDIVC